MINRLEINNLINPLYLLIYKNLMSIFQISAYINNSAWLIRNWILSKYLNTPTPFNQNKPFQIKYPIKSPLIFH